MRDTEQLKYEKALEYEIFIKEEYGFSKEEIKKATCIFDIWWHIWLSSKWCRKYNKDAIIHYFEPIKELYNRAVNTLKNDDKIILNNLWISTTEWSWKIKYNNEKTMQSSKYTSFLNPKWKEINVNYIKLSTYLKENNINTIDILKIDIEWMEFDILPSFSHHERCIIQNLILEVHILDKTMEIQWDNIYNKIINNFSTTKVYKSWYREEIFLLRAKK